MLRKPSFIRFIRNNVLPFPYVYGLKFTKYYRWLSKVQWLPSQEIDEMKNERLRRLIKHAYENVQYYRKVFDERGLKPSDIQCKEDLKLLPIIRKDDIRKNLKLFMAKNYHKYGPFVNYTGGTTGKPLRFLGDKISSTVHNACVWRYRNWAGYNYGDKIIIMRYKTFESSYRRIPLDMKGNTLYLSAFHLRRENVYDYLNIIQKFNPKAIWAFPSTLYLISRYIQKRNVKLNIDLKAIFTSSETLFKHFRESIENAFQCKIYDWYGSNEDVVTAAECPNGNYHITEEGILEIVDFKGEECAIGQKGKVVGTSLWNYAMPFIRYELGDIASITTEKCTCGRGLPLLKTIEGRIDDIIITKDKRLIGRLDEAFHYSYGIKESQIIQPEVGRIIVKIVKDENFSDKDIQILDYELRRRLGTDMNIEYEFVDEIPRTRSGKFKFVISEIELEDVIG